MRGALALILLLATGEALVAQNIGSRQARRSKPRMNLLGVLEGLNPQKTFDGPCVIGEEELMSPKKHGTSNVPVQSNLRWRCDGRTADNICNFNRHYAEYAGYWERSSTFLQEEAQTTGEITFYDSNTGKPLFYAPRGRTWEQFVRESKSHGWPSFRDEEVNWDLVRCLSNGEAVSTAGTHLGHNLPDGKGNRYCINLVSVAGRPADGPVERYIGPPQ